MDENLTGADSTRTIKPVDMLPLDRIVDRIRQAVNAAREIGNKLHNHADRVHGSAPEEAIRKGDVDHAEPSAALDRIFLALDELDHAQSYMAEGAGRNTTLA